MVAKLNSITAEAFLTGQIFHDETPQAGAGLRWIFIAGASLLIPIASVGIMRGITFGLVCAIVFSLATTPALAGEIVLNRLCSGFWTLIVSALLDLVLCII